MNRPGFHHEEALWSQGVQHVAGVDEAGRGPLAGPVVVAAVIFCERVDIRDLNDSKKLTAAKRQTLYAEIIGSTSIRYAVSVVDPAEIDNFNILRATHLGMARVLAELKGVEYALIDGLPAHGLPVPHTALVAGDTLSCSIAAASIIAKVTRDQMMLAADRLYPQYGFAQHKGYPTPAHLSSLRKYGPSPIHRFSFAPVAQTSLAL